MFRTYFLITMSLLGVFVIEQPFNNFLSAVKSIRTNRCYIYPSGSPLENSLVNCQTTAKL